MYLQVQLREKRRMYKTGVKVIGEGWIEQVQFSEKRGMYRTG